MASAPPLQIILCDLFLPITRAWEREFSRFPEVEVRRGDLTDISADAYVSPANSYGDMGGGIDYVLRERFGVQIEDRVISAIKAVGKMLPVGQALIVPTQDDEVPYLVVAPTMEVPSIVAHTANAYKAMKALLCAWREWEREHPGEIQTIAIPGLCTGIGAMDPFVAAIQMREAYEEFVADLAVEG